MHHIDEHTLELYVLHAKEVEERRGEIDEHLAGCHGCRQLMEEMADFHAELKEELKEVPSFESSDETALVRRNLSPVPFYETYAPPAPYRPATFVGKFFYFVQKHPIAAGAGSFVTMGVVAAALFLTMMRPASPASWKYNTTSGTIDVYDDHYVLLWQLPSPDVTQENTAQEGFTSRTSLADLNGDGKNELITTVRLAGDERELNGPYDKLRVIDVEAKKVVLEIPFIEPVSYLNRPYSPYFLAKSLFVDDVEERGEEQIIVSVRNDGRSPGFIARVDSKGSTLGKFWHFGDISIIYAVDVNGDGRNEIIACGTNDTQDTTHGEFPTVVVLDPRKITGTTRSSICLGFDLPPSDADIYCIKFPDADIDIALRQHGCVSSMNFDGPDILRFTVSTGFSRSDSGFCRMDYFFSKQMVPLHVKSENSSEVLHALLQAQGKVAGTIDQAYLENLKNGIRYWDGKEWRKEVVRVEHSAAKP